MRILLLTYALAACGSTTSDVVTVGQGRFVIRARFDSDAVREATRRAAVHCAREGLDMVAEPLDTRGARPELHFSCGGERLPARVTFESDGLFTVVATGPSATHRTSAESLTLRLCRHIGRGGVHIAYANAGATESAFGIECR